MGATSESQDLLELAIEHTEGDGDGRAPAPFAAAVGDAAGHFAQARAHAETAIVLYDRVDDPVGAGRAVAALATRPWEQRGGGGGHRRTEVA